VPSEKTQSGSGNYSYLPAKPGSASGGVTIAERAGCISIALRVVTHLEGTVTNCSHLTGTVINEKTEGRVHSCTHVPKGGTCDPTMNSCPGWSKDVNCTPDDWNAAERCDDSDVGRLDDDQNQVQNTSATFDLYKIGKVGDTFSCESIQQMPTVIGKPNRGLNITCTTPK
jgi:hypothetical protein